MNIKNRKNLILIFGVVSTLAIVVTLIFACVQHTPNTISTEKTSSLNTKKQQDESIVRSQNSSDSDLLSSKVQTSLENLRSELEDLKQNQQKISLDAGTNANSDEVVDPPSIEELEFEAEVKTEALVNLLDGTLQSEPIDQEWSNSSTIALYDAFPSDNEEGFEIVELDCQSTICRMRLNSDLTSPEESLRNIQDYIPWNAEIFFQGELDSSETVVYIAREEHSLPMLTQ